MLCEDGLGGVMPPCVHNENNRALTSIESALVKLREQPVGDRHHLPVNVVLPVLQHGFVLVSNPGLTQQAHAEGVV